MDPRPTRLLTEAEMDAALGRMPRRKPEPARPTAATWVLIGALIGMALAGVAFAETAWTAHNAARLDAEFGR